MDSSVFLGGSVVAAVVAGTIALFAPCCISVMLPAYFAGSFQNRRVLTAMTFVFAAGIATVILPIALGAAALRQIFLEEHTTIYLVGGSAMVALGVYTLFGGRLKLPMPGRRSSGGTGPWAVYSLGVFSGVASSCCAPVLAGVIALSGLASSFGVALGLGGAYVFGMVVPLFVIAVLWERRDLSESRLFRPRTVSLRLGRLHQTVTGTALASGILLTLMGLGTIAIGLQGEAMPAADDWQADVAVALQRAGAAVTDALDVLPGWFAAIVVLGIVATLGHRAWRQTTHPNSDPTDIPASTDHTTVTTDSEDSNEPHPHVQQQP
ncbi:cytochrome c biogenesis CcdA family protein [Euzebya pacifica]|uniref:cytochrome c biogenesis CcdA family protein n=1 Tax=Euzebya pacifica TaxID=1608957 RepID=UPI0030F7E9AF